MNMGNEHSLAMLSRSQSKIDISNTKEDSDPPWMN